MRKNRDAAVGLMAAALCPAGAAAQGEADALAADGPVTWEYLITVGGSSLMTLLIVQFIKAPLDKLWKVPTAFVAYMIALAILVAAHTMTGGMSVNTFLLCVLNAFIAATSAMGMYEKTFRKIEKTE